MCGLGKAGKKGEEGKSEAFHTIHFRILAFLSNATRLGLDVIRMRVILKFLGTVFYLSPGHNSRT